MKKVLILVCFLMVLSGIGIASAETLTGTIGGDTDIQQLNYYYNSTSSTSTSPNASVLSAFGVQNLPFVTSLIRFDNGQKPTFTAGALPGNTQDFIAYWDDGGLIGEGTFGYQRLFVGASETNGYQYWVFDSFNNTGITGDHLVNLVFSNYTALGITGFPISYGGASGQPTGYIGLKTGIGTQLAYGDYQLTKSNYIVNEYTCTKPSGLGITGNVTKYYGGEYYGSRVYVVDGVTDVPYTSQSTITTDDFSFNVPAPTIKICVLDAGGLWHNTTQLFSNVTVTPTVTMTPVPTVAPGYVRSNVWVMDHLGNAVHGVDIAMYDVEGTTWSNSTSDADARHYIDTLPYHTLNLYADFTAFPGEFLPASLLGVETGYYGTGYYLVMYPTAAPAGEGNTNLYVTVMDEDTGDLIRAASLTVTYGTATQGGTTGTTGTDIFVVPNQTDIRIAASKFGYTSATQYLNSGTGTVVNTQIELSKLLVTTVPTSTIPPGGVTPAVTADPNDPAITGSTNAKGQEMLNWLAMNGMDLVQLCFLVTMLALLGVKLGK